MVRYFIDVTDRAQVFRDETGSGVQGLTEVCDEAVSTLIDLFGHGLDAIDVRTASASVRDDNGIVVYQATLQFRGATNQDGAEATSGVSPAQNDIIVKKTL